MIYGTVSSSVTLNDR